MELVEERGALGKGEPVFASPPQGGVAHSQQPQPQAAGAEVQGGVVADSQQPQVVVGPHAPPSQVAVQGGTVVHPQQPKSEPQEAVQGAAVTHSEQPQAGEQNAAVAPAQQPEVVAQGPSVTPSQQPQVAVQGPAVTPSQQPQVVAQGPAVAPSLQPQVLPQGPAVTPSHQPRMVPQGPAVTLSHQPQVTPQAAVSNSQQHPSGYIKYPPALAKYEEVAADPRLFMQTLEKLHSTMGTKFMIPIVGGKDLNLHRLFIEVTGRGGIENVIKDRKWKEITAVFNFPPTATNASFVLRKYYLSLLNHYEQIYFFRSEGWNPSAPDPVTPSPCQTQTPKSVESTISPPETNSSAPKRKRATNESVPGAGHMPPAPNCPVVGVIDGKFDHGYLITVRAGDRILQGILYQTDVKFGFQAPQTNNSHAVSGRRRKRRKKLSTLDPTHPKPNRSGYNFFFQEQHARLKPLHPGKDREISKMIGELWNKLTESEKSVYLEIGVKDKERYQSEMVVYRERQKSGGGLVSSVTPIQQLPADNIIATGNADKPISVQREEEDSVSSEESGSSTESESDIEGASPEAETGTESGSLADEVPTESGDDFELRRRDQSSLESGHKTAGSSGTVEGIKDLNMFDKP